jgi:hypothetical protein
MTKDDDDTLCYRSELEAEFAERLRTDIHTCHAQCQRVLCVAVRNAIKDEREACAKLAYEILDEHEGRDFGVPAAIRARGNT